MRRGLDQPRLGRFPKILFVRFSHLASAQSGAWPPLFQWDKTTLGSKRVSRVDSGVPPESSCENKTSLGQDACAPRQGEGENERRTQRLEIGLGLRLAGVTIPADFFLL
jgi:hypothetical protein